MSALKEILDGLRGLSLSELKAVQSRCLYLIGTKHQEETRAQEVDRLLRESYEESGRRDGDEWVRPTSALDAYPEGAVVSHEGKQWRSIVTANVWEPGVSGWRRLSEDGSPPPYEPPTGAHDAYRAGERVTYQGEVYEAVRDGVVHSPSEYPPDWRLIEPEPEPPEDEEPDPEEPTEPGDGDEGDEPEPEPEPPEWETGVDYQPGDRLTYNGSEYVVIQAHTSQAGWTPDAVPALYERVDPEEAPDAA